MNNSLSWLVRLREETLLHVFGFHLCDEYTLTTVFPNNTFNH